MVSAIKGVYEEEKDNVSALSDQPEFSAITADYWTLVAHDGYIALTMHGITKNLTHPQLLHQIGPEPRRLDQTPKGQKYWWSKR